MVLQIGPLEGHVHGPDVQGVDGFDRAEVEGGETGVEEAEQLIESFKDPDINIDLDEVMDELLEEGIDKFIKPFESLMSSLEAKVKQLAAV